MNFDAIINAAKQNERSDNKEGRFLRAGFAPPKKEQRRKELSANVQRFMEKKEEEKRLAEEERIRVRDELLALRSQDSKAKKRVSAMLKSTKGANKAAIADARDDNNTSITASGPAQPDEDDYGYVSQEAQALYAKLMDKYTSEPEDKKFAKKGKAISRDLNGTKDRVRMALEKEKEEEMMPHRRKRRVKDNSEEHASKPERYEEVYEKESTPPPKKKRPPPPPPMDFRELLRIAEKIQTEAPEVVKVKPVPKDRDEPERPMTKKERQEYMRQKEWREHRAARQRAMDEGFANGRDPSREANKPGSSNAIPRIPKLNSVKRPQEMPERKPIPSSSSSNSRSEPSSSRPVSHSTSRDNAPKSSYVDRNPKAPSKPVVENGRRREYSPEVRGSREMSSNNSQTKFSNPSREIMSKNSTERPSFQNKPSGIVRPPGNRPQSTLNSSNKPQTPPVARPRPQEAAPRLKEALSGGSKQGEVRSMGDRRPVPPSKQPQSQERRPSSSSSSVSAKPQGLKRPLPPSSGRSNGESRPGNSNIRPIARPTEDRRPVQDRRPAEDRRPTEDRRPAQDRRPGEDRRPSENRRPVQTSGRPPPDKRPLPPSARPQGDRRPQPPPSIQGSGQGSKQVALAGKKPLINHLPPRYGPPPPKPPQPLRKKPSQPMGKRRIESDSEYDSELDDFIDDGPEEEGENVSSYIKEIFGYDKSRYRDIDEDDQCMESNYAQQMKEEIRSTKLGILEDLEDIQKEAAEKKRKAMVKKRRFK